LCMNMPHPSGPARPFREFAWAKSVRALNAVGPAHEMGPREICWRRWIFWLAAGAASVITLAMLLVLEFGRDTGYLASAPDGSIAQLLTTARGVLWDTASEAMLSGVGLLISVMALTITRATFLTVISLTLIVFATMALFIPQWSSWFDPFWSIVLVAIAGLIQVLEQGPTLLSRRAP